MKVDLEPSAVPGVSLGAVSRVVVRGSAEVSVAPSAVVDVEWVAERLDDPDVRLIEVDVSGVAYEEGHIPGALLWNAYSDLRDKAYLPVGDEEMRRLLARSQIESPTTVITYGYGAHLGFWLLKAVGHDRVKMMVGPREQWTRAGREWSTDHVPLGDSPAPTTTQNASLIASRDAVEAALGSADHVLLDVRSELEFNGARFWPSGATADAGRAGHIPGAVNMPIDLLRPDDQRRQSADEIRAVLEGAGVTADKRVIVYCTIGNRASEAWFTLTHLLGYPDVRVYYASWCEWGKAIDTQIET